MFNIVIVLGIFHFFGAKKTDAISTKTLEAKKNLRILTTRDAEPGEYPYVVIGFGAEELRNKVFTAAMIAKEWVITCSHCIENVLDPHIWYANFTAPLSKESPMTKVLNVYMHPSYRAYHEISAEDVLDNNIALLRVREIDMPSYGRLLSVDYWTLTGAPVTFVSAGPTNRTGNESGPLQVGEGKVTRCDKEFRGFNRHLVCVAPKCFHRLQIPYHGDSGAPLFYDGKIIGLLSYAVYNKFMVRSAYTPVSSYIDWVGHIMEVN